MRSCRVVVGLAAAAVLGWVLLHGDRAAADTPPTGWDRARDPEVGERYGLHLRIEELRHPPGDPPRGMLILNLEKARADLELASAATSPDVRLRFDLGEIYEALEAHAEAAKILEPALAMAPHDPASALAWRSLAFAAAHLDRSLEERDAYDAYLALTPAGTFEVDILSNRAESEMRLGNLDAAVAGYRDVIDRIEHAPYHHRSDFEILVMARWGLAVALDRNGDPGESERAASVAAEEDPQEKYVGDHETTFFVPEYERDWYLALGRAQRAKHATAPTVVLHRWNDVVDTWDDYILRAAPNEPWLPLAKAHLASAKAARAAAELHVPKAKRKDEDRTRSFVPPSPAPRR